MIKKPTDELMNSLNSSSSIDRYLKSEEAHLISTSLSLYLTNLIQEKGLKKSTVIKESELNEIYGYQILSGKRTPSRDKLLSLCFGLLLSLDETQQLLKYAGYSTLYPKNKRDSIIIWSLQHNYNIYQANELLYSHTLETL